MSLEHQAQLEGKKFGSKTRRIISAALLVVSTTLLAAYFERDNFSPDKLAEFSRSFIGAENTARLEAVYFSVQDKTEQSKFLASNGVEDLASEPKEEVEIIKEEEQLRPTLLMTSEVVLGPQKPAPLILPKIKQIQSQPQPEEGVWISTDLPAQTPEDIFLSRTFIRPEFPRVRTEEPRVDVFLFDKRRIQLHLIAGTDSPSDSLSKKGSGRIPDIDRSTLIAAWNGGFQGPHGGFGMIADGLTYRPLKDKLATVAVTKNGTIEMGQWGKTPFSDDLVAIRQNTALLVENGDVTDLANGQEKNNEIWGYVDVNSSEFITRRSAIGLTKNGDLLIANGDKLSVKTLAFALQAVGANFAMQLDMNTPYVYAALYSHNSKGEIVTSLFKGAAPQPKRFLDMEAHDFMYLTQVK